MKAVSFEIDYMQSGNDVQLARQTDSRIQLVTQSMYCFEIFQINALMNHYVDMNVMRMIKLFAWESKVRDQIFERRERELRLIKKGDLALSMAGWHEYKLTLCFFCIGRILDLLALYVRALLPLLAMVVTYATFVRTLRPHSILEAWHSFRLADFGDETAAFRSVIQDLVVSRGIGC